MSKYSHEFKLEVVRYCLENHVGFERAAKHFGLTSPSSIQRWVRRYQENGIEGMVRNHKRYDGNFKVDVVEYMHKNHLSLMETTVRFNLGSDRVIAKWERMYYEEGPQALHEERRGRSRNMNSKPRKKKISKEVEEDLIAENQRLRMENAYLKKLNALVQERIKQENKKK